MSIDFEALRRQATIRSLQKQSREQVEKKARSRALYEQMKSIGEQVAEEQRQQVFSLPKLTEKTKRELYKESKRTYGTDSSTGGLTLRGERAYNDALNEKKKELDLTPFTDWKTRTSRKGTGAGSSTDGILRFAQDDSVEARDDNTGTNDYAMLQEQLRTVEKEIARANAMKTASSAA